MKRKFLLTIITILLLCGCQKTPTTTVIKVENVIADNGETIANGSTIAPTIVEEIDVAKLPTVTLIEEPINRTVTVDGKTITIDGTIIRPSSLNDLCVYEAVEIDYEEEYMPKMMEYWFGEYVDKVETFPGGKTFQMYYDIDGESGLGADLVNLQGTKGNSTSPTEAAMWGHIGNPEKFPIHNGIEDSLEAAVERGNEVLDLLGVNDFEVYQAFRWGYTYDTGTQGPKDGISVHFKKYFQGIPLLSSLNHDQEGYSSFKFVFWKQKVSNFWFYNYNYTPLYVCEECIDINEDTDFEAIFTADFIKEFDDDELLDGACFETIRFEYAAVKEEVNGVIIPVIKPCWRFIPTEVPRYTSSVGIVVDATNGKVYLVEPRYYADPAE